MTIDEEATILRRAVIAQNNAILFALGLLAGLGDFKMQTVLEPLIKAHNELADLDEELLAADKEAQQ